MEETGIYSNESQTLIEELRQHTTQSQKIVLKIYSRCQDDISRKEFSDVLDKLTSINTIIGQWDISE